MYHVSRDGVLRECDAQKGRCPLEHFESEHEGEKTLDARHGSQGLRKEKRHEVALDPEVERAVGVLSEVGRPYIVGGAVRDSFFGAENKDIDIEVHESDLDEITSKLRKEGYSVDEVGKSFGVLKVTGKGVKDLDVSVPRRENRVGSGHRDFKVDLDSLTVDEAVERRDFTFNAVMYDPVEKKIIDPSGGVDDLNSRTLRHVSPKFAEDPLRVMRGFQMASRFGMSYAPETADECKRIRGEYSSLSDERVREEWAKFYTKGKHAKAGIRALQDSGWDDTEPGLRNALKDDKTVDSLERLPQAPREEREAIGLAVTSRAMDSSDGGSFRAKVATSKGQEKEAERLLQADRADLSTSRDRRWFARRDPQFSFARLEAYGRTTDRQDLVDASQRAQVEGLSHGPERDLVRGDEVAASAGRKPGRWMSAAVDELRELQYSRKVTTREGLLAEARKRFS